MINTVKNTKRIFILALAMLSVLCLITSCGGEKSDYKYESVDGGVMITGYTGNDKALVVPEKIDGKTVISVGEAAFDTSQIESIELPETVTQIGKYAFRRCGKLKNVVIKGKITEIADGAFNYCMVLEKIEIPDTVERIGENAFGKAALKKIELPDSVKIVADYAFYNCTALTSFKGGKSLESIGNNAFAGCAHLKELVLEDGLKSVGEFAFASCVSMKDIQFPSGVETLESGVFAGIPFEEYTVSKSIKTIRTNVFAGCKKLKKIYIPDSVETMDSDIFVDCRGFVICGIRDSAAEIYADEYGYKFEEYNFE